MHNNFLWCQVEVVQFIKWLSFSIFLSTATILVPNKNSSRVQGKFFDVIFQRRSIILWICQNFVDWRSSRVRVTLARWWIVSSLTFAPTTLVRESSSCSLSFNKVIDFQKWTTFIFVRPLVGLTFFEFALEEVSRYVGWCNAYYPSRESLVESKLDYKTLYGLGRTYLKLLYFWRVLFYGDGTLLTKYGLYKAMKNVCKISVLLQYTLYMAAMWHT